MTTATSATKVLLPSGNYTIDASHSRMGFVARHAMVSKTRGAFTDFAGGGNIDFETPGNSKIEITIQVASVDTGHTDRDGHLRNSDFFDAEQFPVIKFVSTEVKQVDLEKYSVLGDLTIKGISKPVTIDLEYTGTAIDPWKNELVGFEGKTSINRTDFGVNWNTILEAGGVLVSEKIALEFEISAIRNPEAA